MTEHYLPVLCLAMFSTAAARGSGTLKARSLQLLRLVR